MLQTALFETHVSYPAKKEVPPYMATMAEPKTVLFSLYRKRRRVSGRINVEFVDCNPINFFSP